MAEFVQFEVQDGVGTIRLDRPKLNALGAQLVAELADAAQAATDDRSIGAVVIWGGPAIFAAGADVAEMAELGPADALAQVHGLQKAIDLVAGIPKVTIAAINGYALGGGYELALAADLRYASETAKVGLPEIQLGIIPGAGGTQRLPRLIGASKAKELIYTGRHVRVDEALALGMIDKAIDGKDAYEAACEAARAFAQGPTVALAAAKHAIDAGLQGSLTDGQKIERDVFATLFDTEDQKTGMRSLLGEGPGKATFKGR